MASSNNVDTCLWRAPDLGADMLRGRFSDFSYDVHTHETACFALLTQGAIRIRMRGGEFVARQGDLYAIDADEPHAGWPVDEQGWRLRTVYVGLDALRERVDHAAGRGAVRLAGPIMRDPVLSSLLYQVHRCSEEQGPALLREERYLAFVARLFQRHARDAAIARADGSEIRAVRLARDFIDSRLDDRINLNDIGAAAGLPGYTLFRAFSRAMGMTPHGYQRQARVRAAMGLIRQGLSLSAAAAAAGFADQAHLTRSFRRVMGVTPGAYKTAMHG